MDYVVLHVTMMAREPVELPAFLGSTLRGALGHALKAQACVSKSGCGKTCLVPSSCAYGALMETPIPAHAPSRVQASATAPHTMILTPVKAAGGLLMRGQSLEFTVTLVADALAQLPMLVGGLEAMASAGLGKGQGALKLSVIRDQVSGSPVYREGQRDWSAVTVRTLSLAPTPADALVDAVEVGFETPVQVRHKGELVTDYDFGELVYACADRLWLMFACHAPSLAPLIDAAELASHARALNIQTAVHDLGSISYERWSNRQWKKHELEGMLGVLRFEGPVGNFMPLLRAGSLLHIGKGSTFGLGKITVAVAP